MRSAGRARHPPALDEAATTGSGRRPRRGRSCVHRSHLRRASPCDVENRRWLRAGRPTTCIGTCESWPLPDHGLRLLLPPATGGTLTRPRRRARGHRPRTHECSRPGKSTRAKTEPRPTPMRRDPEALPREASVAAGGTAPASWARGGRRPAARPAAASARPHERTDLGQISTSAPASESCVLQLLRVLLGQIRSSPAWGRCPRDPWPP